MGTQGMIAVNCAAAFRPTRVAVKDGALTAIPREEWKSMRMRICSTRSSADSLCASARGCKLPNGVRSVTPRFTAPGTRTRLAVQGAEG